MTLLSLFMRSTGIFCFVPISQRLIESGIIPASNHWGLPSVLAPTFYAHDEEENQVLFAGDEAGSARSEIAEHDKVLSPLLQIPQYSEEDTLVTEQRSMKPCANSEWSTGTVSPLACSPTGSLLQSTPPVDKFYGQESDSFISDCTLCDDCNSLLRREIPPDHIPSVVRALALFEAQDRFPDIIFNDWEVVALTNAFSMLRL